MQFKIASKAQASVTQAIDSSAKNLMRSYVSKTLLAVYVTNYILMHKKEKTSGINKICYKKPKNEKMGLGFQSVAGLALNINHQFLKNYKCRPVKHMYVLKQGSFKPRFFGISTILDRVVQKMFQLVIDPAVDIFADPNSYGFRKHRSCYNAIGFVANKLIKVPKNTIVIKIVIEKFFVNIDYN
jgi:RNA-directed DNA polymerase